MLLTLSSALTPHFRLQKCQFGVHDVEVLIAQLQEGPQLDEESNYGEHWGRRRKGRAGQRRARPFGWMWWGRACSSLRIWGNQIRMATVI